ncbi:MAG: radical SAM protein [bacterium]|nr:radical SAM protein [bacterium]
MFDTKLKTSEYINLTVTHDCTRRCLFCVDRYRGSGEMVSLDAVHRVAAFASRRGIKDILITGGEPTLHPDIVEIVKIVKKYGLRVIMTTNYDRPNVFEKLDGIVDCFNISFYNQALLPKQKETRSDITIHALIYDEQLETQEKLDRFIDRYHHYGHLKFSTLTPCNAWTTEHQHVSYLDDLECEWIVLFNEMLAQVYRGVVIKRYDRIISRNASQSYKAHVDGTITKSWDRERTSTLSAKAKV